ncbi:DUF1761 domain-containing protein [Afifella marina]|uniref:DUF1761 domain-containing protein n=1 Tax=Afifella marina DSM 2698 TaxID=1120955 RepID=A0A1G5NNJ6_AFIMA|nr:DUF1761 domain-containing protein [Afifella marina]MBK1624583.1 DUF1761 domain-containing protein [Afifella marina DSM 2698]MBK1627476.1 DUF1761 domain-containing protein [Afifella marina]MBK5918534.1 hypothetical protein [Afifella marina]RAI18564.1 hypothetical protein CH311_15350 [Afifella marina DSM 2698]SCZ38957.1 Protein of unknown function [Afifella marina DSM 2698]
MAFAGINYFAVIVAGFAAFGFGAIYYAVLAKPFTAATGLIQVKVDDGDENVDRTPLLVSLTGEIFMAWMLAGLIGHIGEVSIVTGLASGFFVWSGFILVPLVVNHRYQIMPWTLTFIDSGHWLGVVMLQGLIIGAFGT